MTTDRIRLKYPIVLVHGLGAKSKFGPFDYFYGLPKRLRDAGNTVFVADLTAFHTVEHRAAELKAQIARALPDAEKVNLVGHSFGGLDARFLAADKEFSSRVASVTTIGSPNRGSTIADVGLGLVPEMTFHLADTMLGFVKSSTRAYQQITSRYANDILNVRAPNQRGIGYFSATSVIRDPVLRTALPIFWLPHRVVKRYEGENDGFVSVHSAQWGEHICTHIGDHYAQIGHFLGYSRGLDYLKFYDEIFERLKREGF